MTSAARPTFLPAMGGHSLRDTGAGPVSLQSSKDLAAHTKLKFRKIGQNAKSEVLSAQDLKERLLEKERQFREKVKGNESLASSKSIVEQDAKFKEIENLDKDDSCSENDEDEDEDSDEDSDEDDTAELMKELEKIKQERQQEQEKAERLAKEQEEREMEERALTGNPLLDHGNGASSSNATASVKRRWDDDVIFKNQTRGVSDKPEKRFINDMLRSDFHRKFMSKYVK